MVCSDFTNLINSSKGDFAIRLLLRLSIWSNENCEAISSNSMSLINSSKDTSAIRFFDQGPLALFFIRKAMPTVQSAGEKTNWVLRSLVMCPDVFVIDVGE